MSPITCHCTHPIHAASACEGVAVRNERCQRCLDGHEPKVCPKCGQPCLIHGVCRPNMPYYGCGYREPA